jgi:hypothetical protein
MTGHIDLNPRKQSFFRGLSFSRLIPVAKRFEKECAATLFFGPSGWRLLCVPRGLGMGRESVCPRGENGPV